MEIHKVIYLENLVGSNLFWEAKTYLKILI